VSRVITGSSPHDEDAGPGPRAPRGDHPAAGRTAGRGGPARAAGAPEEPIRLFDLDTPPAPLAPTRLHLWQLLLACGFLLAAATAGLIVGPAGLSPGAVLEEVLVRILPLPLHPHLSATGVLVVFQLRLPEVVLGALVGGMLAVSGAAYQGVFSNPLADPYLLGVASGAGLGATLALVNASHLTHLPIDPVPLAAFVGALGATGATLALGRSRDGVRAPATLLLAGVAIAALLTAVQTFVQQQNAPDLQVVYSWILGGLSTAGWSQVELILPYVVPAMIVLVALRRLLDALSVGDEESTAIGVRAQRVRLLVIIAATLGTAAAVSVSGLIGFVGIVVPHGIRLVAGPSYRRILPLSILVGGGFLILCDVLANEILAPAEVPLGVVTACVGAPFFLIVLRQARRSL
jgi:iron complex transport system permease protein